ncbi:MAG: hypothetical protein HOP29_11660 [Phycisphaerales bacterium]|nr:hypothetical protein [Phycisphaerales bacterium]
MMWRRYALIGGAVAVNAWLWAVPSNVVELVARDRQTLLGRYSREHFTWIIVAFVASGVAMYVHLAPRHKRRRRWFQVVAALLALAPTLVIADALLRRPQRVWYVHDSPAYHRVPNDEFSVEFVDRPLAARSYPIVRPGHPPVTCRYRTDNWGFRNRDKRDRYEIVAVGDSFTEGSGVSDDDAWPVRLAETRGRSVYNLGMSGYAPLNYLAAIETYGLTLRPAVVLCMVYEGNDFRSDDDDPAIGEPEWGDRLDRYVRQSPIRNAMDDWMIRTFAPIGAKREMPVLEVLAWLPIGIPEGPDARYYAFAPKQILQASSDADEFRRSPHWTAVADILGRMKRSCGDGGAQLVIVHAPTKAGVTLPLVRDRLPADDVRAFAALRAESLPAGDRFMELLFERLPARENVVRQWAAENEIAFVSTTDALRRAAADGEQVYYTYDQHWTPVGHAVVADTIHRFLVEQNGPDGAATAAATLPD